MAITVEARTNIIGLVVGMFNAAPGASVLSDLVAAYEAGSSIKQIAANLANTDQFKGMFQTFLTNTEYSAKVVDQLLAEASTAAKDEAKAVLTAALNGGMSRSDAFVEAITFVNATESTNTAFGTSAAAFDNKVSVATYYSVDKALSGSSLQNLQNVVASVTSSAATVTAANAEIDKVGNPGTTFSFTVGVDALSGGAGDDVFNAVVTGASATLGALDVADGGAGNDTANIVETNATSAQDYLLPTGLTLKNIETLSVTSNGALGTAGTTNFDVSGIAGLTSFIGAAAGNGTGAGSQIKAASTTDVNLTTAGTATSTVNGGKSVTINGGSGVVTVTGSGLTAVSVAKGSGSATIDNVSATAVSGAGKTLTSVTLSNDAGAAVKGAAISTLTLSGQGAGGAAQTIAVTNTTVGHSLTVNAAGTGYATTGAFATVVNDTAATSATVNTTATSALNLAGSTAVTSVTLTGSGNLNFAPMGAAVTSIDGSAATGKLTLGTLNAAAVTVKTGSADDSLTISATAATTVATNAGKDTVTLASAIAAGSTISLGDGDDLLLKGAGSVAPSTTGTNAKTTVIDAGAGTDSVAASLINAANAAQFVNFELIDLSGATTSTLDLDLVTGSTITGLNLAGGTGGASVSNVAAGVGLTVAGSNTGTSTIAGKSVSGTSDAFTVTFAGAAASSAPTKATIAAGTVVVEGIEAVTVASSGGANTWNSIALTDAKLKTVTVTGDKNLDLTFVGVNGTNPSAAGGGVSLIDGSAATGKLSINTTNVVADSASTGLTVKGGSADDTVTLAGVANVEGGAGKDNIITSASGGKLTGGADADTFDVTLAVATGTTAATSVLTTITDFTAGDKIDFAAGATTFQTAKVALGVTVTNIDLALAAAIDAANEVAWFQYGSDTYVVADNNGSGTFNAGDTVVKLTGLVDLANSTLAATVLTFA